MYNPITNEITEHKAEYNAVNMIPFSYVPDADHKAKGKKTNVDTVYISDGLVAVKELQDIVCFHKVYQIIGKKCHNDRNALIERYEDGKKAGKKGYFVYSDQSDQRSEDYTGYERNKYQYQCLRQIRKSAQQAFVKSFRIYIHVDLAFLFE